MWEGGAMSVLTLATVYVPFLASRIGTWRSRISMEDGQGGDKNLSFKNVKVH